MAQPLEHCDCPASDSTQAHRLAWDDNTRLIGFDNAHGVKPVGSRFKHVGKRFPYDHRHRHALDEGVLYEFDTAYQLVSDFYAEVDRVLKEISP